ncbi:MAG: sulfatase-like hydrolase/transferase [Paramuribaculum sp.]|nr:sulfatase-like hydrolase/transferase [Paramuribaculum sp.]
MNRKGRSCAISARNWLDTLRHGSRSDAIIASYLTALPLLISAAATCCGLNPFWPLTVYFIIAGLVTGLISVGDSVLYRFWSAKIDASVLPYLRTPREAVASVSVRYVAGASCLAIAVSAIYIAGAITATRIYTDFGITDISAWWGYPLIILATLATAALLAIIIRGLGLRPNNPSMAYYSPEPFFNHWALNPVYNFIYSLGTKDAFSGRFVSMTDEECDAELRDALPTHGSPTTQLLTTDRPNILFIVWESLGGEFTGCVGDKPEVTPNLDRLASKGVLLSRCSASSFRTDRGIVAALSGLPGQPTTSIIRYTRKLAALPALPATLAALGYDTIALHGGELTFMHLADYFLASGHKHLISKKDFPAEADRCKWGVHDGPVMDRAYTEIEHLTRAGKPWYMTLLTLSSHEPFVVPTKTLPDEIDNAYAYTDRSLGQLIEKLKSSPAWDNLLIVVMADHGLNLPDDSRRREDYCHIPVVLAGGAVKAPTVIDTPTSQTDVAATILGQMGIDHSEFAFSRDVTADTYSRPFGFHTYSNGFLLTDTRGVTDYDNVADRPVDGADASRQRLGKALLQRLYSYLSKL